MSLCLFLRSQIIIIIFFFWVFLKGGWIIGDEDIVLKCKK